MHNGRSLVNSSIVTNNNVKEQLWMAWYPLILSCLDNYEKDMVPFDIRWAINDVETHAFGTQAQTTNTWSPKVLDKGLHILHISHNIHNASYSGK